MDAVLPYQSVINLMLENGGEDGDRLLTSLLASNLLFRAPDGFGITHLGRRTVILLDALNGVDLRDVWRRLGQLDPSLRSYELLRNNLTDEFLNSLATRPSFGRLYICSPWINFGRRQERLLAAAVQRAERGGAPEILVVTRPEKRTDGTSVPSAGRYFQGLGAKVFLNKSLHS